MVSLAVPLEACSCSLSNSTSRNALPAPTSGTWHQLQLLTHGCNPIQPSIQPKRQAASASALSSQLTPRDAHLVLVIRTAH